MVACRAFLFVTILAVSACGGGGTASSDVPRLVVSVAVSLSDALRRAADEFEQATDVVIVLNAGGSDTLATQLLAGASVDLFFSADTRQMDRVEAVGGIVALTRVDLLSNQLVAVSHIDRVGLVSGVTALERSGVRWIAMGDPDSVPAGVYAREFLVSMGIWDVVRSKVMPTRNVRAVIAAVEAGNADVGFVYRTDVALAEGVGIAFVIPVDQGPQIRYVAAVATEAPHAVAARQFLDFLRTGRARRIFEDAGFIGLGGVLP
jgi:molybdate transport system substrate-binding protein